MEAKKAGATENFAEDTKPSHDRKPGRKSATITIKKEEASQQEITGRALIEGFALLKTGALAKYQQLCMALDSFDSWNEESRCSFLQQFIDIYDILDANCAELVYKLCMIRWYAVPSALLPSFVNFLSALAISHVHHINHVFRCFVVHLSPPSDASSKEDSLSSSSELILDEQLQELIYTRALQAIQTVISCNPLTSRVLVKCCVKQFPHIKQPVPKLVAFVRNLIHLADWTDDEEVAAELWSLIVEKLLLMDASCSELQDEEQRLSFCNHGDLVSNIALGSSSNNGEADEADELELENPMETKMDQLIAVILAYLDGSKCNFGTLKVKDDPNFTSLLGHNKRKDHNTLFKFLLEAFDEHVLATVGVHSTPFIWFYLCSLSKENCSSMLEFLWDVLHCPVDSPNEWKKAHNAAAFLCGFLARANYVDFKLSCSWMDKISKWCRKYVRRFSDLKRGRSYGLQHGTFYAVVQALLFVFCYRHRELQEQSAYEQVHSWRLGEIVHSPLEPLRWISQGVALTFLSVNRQVKLLNCGSNLLDYHPSRQNGRKKKQTTALELFFPFSFCSLKICADLILPLMRRFSPTRPINTLKEDDDEEQATQDLLQEMDGAEVIPNTKGHSSSRAECGASDSEGEEDAEVSDESMPVDEGYEEELMSGNVHTIGHLFSQCGAEEPMEP